MYTVFLTGGIASGKSHACAYLASKGAAHMDLDQVARQVSEDPEVLRQLALRFGPDVLTWPDGAHRGLEGALLNSLSGSYGRPCFECDVDPYDYDGLLESGQIDLASCGCHLDRALLARRAFASEEDTAALNAIMHPPIVDRLAEFVMGACCCSVMPKVGVVEVQLPTAVPKALGLADEVLLVSAPVEVRRSRAIGRGMDGGDFDVRASRQPTDAQYASVADTIIDNSLADSSLERALDQWWDAHEESHWAPLPSRPDVP